jgi:histone H3
LLTGFIAKALQETRMYRGTFDMSIPKAPFQQLVREIVSELGGRGMRIQSSALLALQESAEALLVTEFECKPFLSVLLILILI